VSGRESIVAGHGANGEIGTALPNALRSAAKEGRRRSQQLGWAPARKREYHPKQRDCSRAGHRPVLTQPDSCLLQHAADIARSIAEIFTMILTLARLVDAAQRGWS
jgi:hypothetical protein